MDSNNKINVLMDGEFNSFTSEKTWIVNFNIENGIFTLGQCIP